MKTIDEIKADFDKNLNNEKVTNLELTKNQKTQLKNEDIKFISSQKELIKKAIEQCIPVDVYFHYNDENDKPLCGLEYPRFMFTEIDDVTNQFWGYTFEMATLPTSQKILTSGDIGAICKIESDDLEIENNNDK